MVYFIGSLKYKLVKIGYTSTSVDKRRSSLNTSCPFELTVLYTVEGDQSTEFELQQRFSDYHMRGEWYRIAGELAWYIGQETNYEELVMKDIVAVKHGIADLCFQLQLNGTIPEREIANFAEGREQICLKLLENIKKHNEDRIAQGLRAESPLRLFREKAEDVVQSEKKAKYEELVAAGTQQEHDAYYQTIEKGWQPTQCNLSEMLQELRLKPIAEGGITEEQYKVAMRSGVMLLSKERRSKR